mmetsp:Transcript_24503/g.73543  ORF Transcript_24503/g.73543 Transcript_24503/m.73543 type:complete len:351 (-) Transcript_24503:37-1089(-)
MQNFLPRAVEEALRTLEHTDRLELVRCGADKRIRLLAKTTATKHAARTFDASLESPKRLALAFGRAGRAPLVRNEFCTDLVAALGDVEDVAALSAACGLLRARCKARLGGWKALKRRVERADLADCERVMLSHGTSARAMYWVLSRLSRMGAEGVAYEHGRRLKCSESLRLSPARVTELTALCRAAERRERPLYGHLHHIGCPPKLVRFSLGHYSVRHVHCERNDVHSWTRHSGSKYWSGIWGLLARHCEVTRRKPDGARFVLERFVFPSISEEWIAVAEVAADRKYYTPQLELVARLRACSPAAYLKVKPCADRSQDVVGELPPVFRRCGAAPAWASQTFQVPWHCMHG